MQARGPPRWCAVLLKLPHSLPQALSWLPPVSFCSAFPLGSPPVSHVLPVDTQHWSGLFSLLIPTLQISRSVEQTFIPPATLMSPGILVRLLPLHLTPSRQLSLWPLSRTETSCPLLQCTGSDSVLGPRLSARSRTRWLLLQTLINNPELVRLRKSRPGLGSQEFTQILLTCSESWHWPSTLLQGCSGTTSPKKAQATQQLSPAVE